MTYMHEGRQYIVIAVSTREHPAELVALALPSSEAAGGQEPAPAAAPRESTATAPAAIRSSQLSSLRGGREIYARSCAACHGARGEGVSGSTSPLSGVTDYDYIRRVVTGGSIKMPAMRTLLTKEDIERVSRFVAGGMKTK
jgi:quinoprotein glucose dehydrogenase